MNTARNALRIALAALAVLLVACTTPTQEWATARTALTTAEDTMLSLHAAGLLDDREIVDADVAVQAARAGLERADEYLPDGGTEFSAWLDVVSASLQRLRQVDAKHATPTKGTP